MTFFELFARLGLVISGALGAGRGRRVPGPDERPARCVAERDLLMQLEIVDGDLLAQEVDVIVNAWNRNIIPWWLLIPQGVSGAIKKRGGTTPFRELARFGALPLGSAALTVAGRLPYRGIIHVCGINMIWRASELSIRRSVASALEIAREHRFSSIAFPVLGSGSGGFDRESALAVMISELESSEYAGSVVIVRDPEQPTARSATATGEG